MWINEGQQDSDSTHTALLLNVKPIASSDSWEKLERDIKGGRFDSLQVGRAFKEIAIRAVELMKEQKW